MKLTRKLSEYKMQSGIPSQTVVHEIERTQRMLFWETGSFLVFIGIVTGVLSWLYLRDLKRSRAIQAFFASFTHELRTPITSIKLQAESIAENSGDGVQTKKLIGRLLDESSRLESQIEKTLELARMEGGGVIHVQSIPIRPWLEKFIRQYPQVLENKTNFEIAVDDVEILADRSALLIVFRNLIENSIKHSNTVHLKIDIHSKNEDGKLIISFKDNGMSTESEKKLGSLFQKGKHSQGAGVGLYLIRMLMKKMDGGSSFRNDPDGFNVELIFRTSGGQ